MAETAVFFLLEKLTLLLEEELKMVMGFKEEVEYIKDELERMTAFLRVADAAEESDPELKVWVKQVRDVTYDIEAILDKCTLHLMQNELPHCNTLYIFFTKILRSIKSLRFSYKIGCEIQSIKSRINNVADGHQRYRNKFNIPDHGLNLLVVNNAMYERRDDALLLEEVDLIGIEWRKTELIGLIKEKNSPFKVVSVVGMGGLGKTTLVKKVYDEAAFKKNFQSHAWVTFSQSFKIEELLKGLLQQLFDEIKQPVSQEVNTMNCNQLKVIIKQFLRQRRYLLVFDDIWSTHAWDSIKLALPNNIFGSCVIITTRLIDVASYSSKQSDGYIYEMKPLSIGEAWSLFCQKTFEGSSCPSHLRELSMSILKRCAGLPLAIVAISGVLATKSASKIDDWVMLNQSLGAELEGNDRLESVKLILSLSFNDLPYYLKSCLLYLTIYPEDYVIEKNNLIRIWVTEGFVRPKDGRTMEEVAEGYLNELVNRNLIHVVRYNDDGSFKSGCLHDFLREILLSKSRDQNFVITTTGQHTIWPNKVRHLSIHGKLSNLQLKRCGAQLHSLHAFGMEGTQSMSNLLVMLNNCRMLKVLDLRGASLEVVPKVVFKLFHLRYLSLRSTKVKSIPRSIVRLQKLETLDLKDTYITELPSEILHLQHLRHLLVYRHVEYSYLPFDCILGFKALKGIGKLASLQKLSFIEATLGSDIFEQLEMMKELRRVSILKLRKEDGMPLCKSLQMLHKVRAISLSSIKEDEIIDLQYISSPPPFLQRLYLNGRLARFPKWIQYLHSLVKIYFRWSQLEEDPLEYLQELPNLVHLEFLVGYLGSELCFKAGKFQKLQLLNLDKVEPMRIVIIEKGAMTNLEKLIIQRCNFLESVPIGIEWLSNMKYLEFLICQMVSSSKYNNMVKTTKKLPTFLKYTTLIGRMVVGRLIH
ncbi:hypothetical protein ACH5RR_032044 [Cinchona calisaya]|uniref:Uncharacterized protein n=1 Tax=Cinchona calisaya TaxID=153742 RepID=A0ABD2YK16_9GENT